MGGAGGAGRAGGPGADLIERALRPAVSAYQAQTSTQGSPGRAAGAQQDVDAARALLEKIIAAKGGFDTLRAVKSITAITRADADTPAGRVTAQTTTYLQYPNHVRVETKLPGETVVQVYDGSRAWVRDSRGTHDVPDRMARELDASFERDIISLLIGAREGRVHPRLLPDARDTDGKVRHALEFSTPSLEPTVLYIDPDTNLIASQTYVAGGPGQPLVEERFSDYKPVSGVQVAFTATVRQAGQAVAERHVDSIKFNAALDSALFRRP